MDKLELKTNSIQLPEGGVAFIFEYGTIVGEYQINSGFLDIIAIVNQEKNNGHFALLYKVLLECCVEDYRPLMFSKIENKDFFNHLVNKKGFNRFDEETALLPMTEINKQLFLMRLENLKVKKFIVNYFLYLFLFLVAWMLFGPFGLVAGPLWLISMIFVVYNAVFYREYFKVHIPFHGWIK